MNYVTGIINHASAITRVNATGVRARKPYLDLKLLYGAHVKRGLVSQNCFAVTRLLL